MPMVYVSIGSNIDRDHNIRSAVKALREEFHELIISPVYETAAQGFVGDPFYNLVVGFETAHTVDEISAILRHIENRHGRQRGQEKFSSRTLDLDLLLYGESVFDDKDIPRQEINRYAFVLQPLAEIAPDCMHPRLNISLKSLWDEFKKNHQVTGSAICAIDFNWEI